MHKQNPYHNRYDIKKLVQGHSLLQEHVIFNPNGQLTINFSSSKAVYALNKAILLKDFGLKEYHLPKGYLIPPIPGRLDYLLHLRDFLSETLHLDVSSNLQGLDIGAGANGIYCILGAQYFNWTMIGAESDAKAIEIAKENIKHTKSLQDTVELRYQKDKGSIFKNIIKPNERFDFTVCNPPFHSSQKEAIKGSLTKSKRYLSYYFNGPRA